MPDGSIGKMPVITFSDDGIIEDIRIAAEGFREEAGLEYYGGVLIPGLIQDLRGFQAEEFDPDKLKRLLNRLYSRGSLRYLCNGSFERYSAFFSGKAVFGTSVTPETDMEFISAWDKVTADLPDNGNVAEALSIYLKKIVEELPPDVKWGTLEKGADPGLILIKGIDYNGMKLKQNTTLKILIK
jgi:hypothetical protein